MARRQVAAFAYRLEGSRLKLVLITSRGGRRWILPKGQPEPHLSDSQTALMEAYEEAGVVGKLDERIAPCEVSIKARRGKVRLRIFCISIDKLARDYPETGVRQRELLGVKAAVARIDRKALRDGVKELARRVLEVEGVVTA